MVNYDTDLSWYVLWRSSEHISLSYLAAVKWNSAPPDIRNATSLHDLRIQLCTWLGHPVRRPIGL